MLGLLLISIISTGYSAFTQAEIKLEIDFDPKIIDPDGTRQPEAIRTADYQRLVKESLYALFPDVTNRREKRRLTRMVSNGAGLDLRDMVVAEPNLIGQSRAVWLKTSDDIDSFIKGFIPRDVAESERRVKDNEIGWIDALDADGRVETPL